MTEESGLELELTDSAASKVNEFYARMPEAKGKPLRIYIKGGGCSGYEYGFTFDDKRADDLKGNYNGINVIVDPRSAEMLQGATLDYIDDFRGAGFSVENPNAKGGCGCGKSFC